MAPVQRLPCGRLVVATFCLFLGNSMDPDPVLADAAPEAGPPRPSLSVTTEVVSRSMWRAIPLTNGPSFEPTIELGYAGASIGLWADIPYGAEDEQRFQELDVLISHEGVGDRIHVKPSLSFYTYPGGTAPSTAEFQVELSASLGRGWGVTSTYGVDVAEYRGAGFGEAGVEFSTELPRAWELELAATGGWGDRRFGNAYLDSEEPLSTARLCVGLTIPAGHTWSLAPRLEYHHRVRPDVVSGIAPSRLVAAVSLGRSF